MPARLAARSDDQMTTDEVRIEPADPADPAFARLHEALDRELGELYPADSIYSVEPDKLDAPGCCLLLGRTAGGEAVACGALRRLSADQAEIKRMYVVPKYRGQALGRRILEGLEARAAAFGYKSLRLETGERQPAAIGLYRSFGYVQIPCYNEYAYDPHSLCFEKRLGAADAAPAPGHAVTDG